jgi:hypothetical protein
MFPPSFISFPVQVHYMAASVRGEGAETIPGMPVDLDKNWSRGEDLAQGVEVRLDLKGSS